MNVKSKLKSRANKLVPGLKNHFEDEKDEKMVDTKTHNFKTELFNVFLVGLCFCLLFGGFNTMSPLTVSNLL